MSCGTRRRVKTIGPLLVITRLDDLILSWGAGKVAGCGFSCLLLDWIDTLIADSLEAGKGEGLWGCRGGTGGRLFVLFFCVFDVYLLASFLPPGGILLVCASGGRLPIGVEGYASE